MREIMYFKGLVLIFFTIFLSISCSIENDSSNKVSWSISEGVEYPEGGKLSRAEDGVILADGTLIVADQRHGLSVICLLYTSPSPRDRYISRMPSSA